MILGAQKRNVRQNVYKNKHKGLWNKLNFMNTNNDSVAQNTRGAKKRKLENSSEEAPAIYVSASSIKNYLLKDPMVDHLEIHQNKKRKMSESEESDKSTESVKLTELNKSSADADMLNILFANGNEFEAKINADLLHKFGSDVITINTEGRKGLTTENIEKTISAMKTGFPIIIQGVLRNVNNYTCGVFDLIVRSDYINKIVNREVLNETEQRIKAPNLSGNYHYRVIDIKWSKMTLCADGQTIRNDGRFPSYKGQLAIYNCEVGNIQGYIPPKAYIMPKHWKIDRKHNPLEGFGYNDLLGPIDFDGFDYQFIDKTVEAVKWRRKVISEGAKWDLLNPTMEEMYPNMSNKNDGQFAKAKHVIAKHLNEVTQIAYVNDSHRKTLHDQGIMSWKDPRCNSLTMGMTGEFRTNIVDEILEVNRSTTCVIRPKIIKNNLNCWQQSSPVDFYVDFETIGECLYKSEINIHNSRSISDIVFMIGVGYVKDNKFIYKVFNAKAPTMIEESRIFTEFVDYLTEKTLELDPEREFKTRLFHWSQAELTNVKHVNARHNNKFVNLESDKDIVWVDMYSVFTKEPIVIKGALDYKLKHIGKALYDLGLIQTLWDSNGPSNGFNAMGDAVRYYRNNPDNDNPEQNQNFKSIIDYNEVDCKIIWEIVDYLRKNRCVAKEDDY